MDSTERKTQYVASVIVDMLEESPETSWEDVLLANTRAGWGLEPDELRKAWDRARIAVAEAAQEAYL